MDAILVTHEHSDHIKGIGVLAQALDSTYAIEKHGKPWLERLGKSLEQQEIFNTGDTPTFGDLDARALRVSHDAAAPQFYSFQREASARDADRHGLCDKLRGLLKNADAYLIECNQGFRNASNGDHTFGI